MCILKNLAGGPHTLVLEPSVQTKFKDMAGIAKLHELIAPLAAMQPYIAECRIIKPGEEVDWKSAGFRVQHYYRGRTLMHAHLEHLILTKGIGHGIHGNQKWLECEASGETKGRVVVNRTGRYRNPWFNWESVVRHYRHRLLFVGLPHEWREFCGQFGYVEFRPTANLLEMARLIAGAELFIGNQSCANALAEGLKRPLVQETDLTYPDCIYGREDAQHVANGSCLLPDVAQSGVYETHGVNRTVLIKSASLTEMPPGGWQAKGQTARTLKGLLRILQVLHPEKDLACLRNEVIMENVDRVPEFFAHKTGELQFHQVRAALPRAGITEHPLFAKPKFQIV